MNVIRAMKRKKKKLVVQTKYKRRNDWRGLLKGLTERVLDDECGREWRIGEEVNKKAESNRPLKNPVFLKP